MSELGTAGCWRLCPTCSVWVTGLALWIWRLDWCRALGSPDCSWASWRAVGICQHFPLQSYPRAGGAHGGGWVLPSPRGGTAALAWWAVFWRGWKPWVSGHCCKAWACVKSYRLVPWTSVPCSLRSGWALALFMGAGRSQLWLGWLLCQCLAKAWKEK